MLLPALIVDTDDIVFELNGGDSGTWIEDNIEIRKRSVAPGVLLPPRRIGVLLQNIAGPKVVESDLGDMKRRWQLWFWWMTYLFPVIPSNGCICLICNEVRRANRDRPGIWSSNCRRGGSRFLLGDKAFLIKSRLTFQTLWLASPWGANPSVGGQQPS